MDPTLSREMPCCTTIDLFEILRSSKISLWIWSIIYGVVSVLGRPGRGPSQVEKLPRLNWATQFLTVAYDGACFSQNGVNFLRRLALQEKNLMTAHIPMLLKTHASPDMLPFSLCNKKRLAIWRMNRRPLPNDTIDSILWHREVGWAKDLSAPPPRDWNLSYFMTPICPSYPVISPLSVWPIRIFCSSQI